MPKPTSKAPKLNGSIGRLATALGDVFLEANAIAMDGVTQQMNKMEDRLNHKFDKKIGDLDKRIVTTNKNTQVQLAQLRKDFKIKPSSKSAPASR